MKTAHAGMRISASDWTAFIGHLEATLAAFAVPPAECRHREKFIQRTRPDIVEM
jgi:hemoglobin